MRVLLGVPMRIFIVMPVPMAVIVVAMRIGCLAEQASRAKIVPDRGGNVDQLENARIGGETPDGVFQPRRQPAADMNHHVRLGEHPRLRGTHRVSVRRRLLVDQKLRRFRALRHHRDKPVHGRDVGDDAQRRGRRRARRNQRQRRKRARRDSNCAEPRSRANPRAAPRFHVFRVCHACHVASPLLSLRRRGPLGRPRDVASFK